MRLVNKLLAAAMLCFACSTQPAAAPELSPNAVDAALMQIAVWGAAHKAPAEDLAALAQALQKRSYVAAVDAAQKLLSDSEVAGEYVPKELSALVKVANDAAHSMLPDADH